MADNALDLLKHDHQTVRKLLDQLVETTGRAEKTRAELLARIEEEINVHARIEEEVFYPAFKKADGKEHEKMFYEALEEHRAVEQLVLPDLRNTDLTSEQFSGRAKVLKELIEHHADEEESEMFVEAKKSMPKETLEELGRRIKQRKLELKREGGSRKSA